MANKDWEALRQAHKSKFKSDQSPKEKRQVSGSPSAPERQEDKREGAWTEDKPDWQPLAAPEDSGPEAGSGSHLDQSPAQPAPAFSPVGPAASEFRESEPAVKKIPPRLNARKSSPLKSTSSSSWNRQGEDGEDSAEIPSIYSILLVLAVLGIGLLAMNPPASSSGTSTSYNENQLGLPTSEERKMTHEADIDWIAAEEDKPVVVTYEQVLDLIMGEDSRYYKPDMDQTVAKLGKAKSGEETKYDGRVLSRSLDYDDPESGASLTLHYSSLYSPTSPRLSMISGNNLPSPNLPNRNDSLTPEDFAEIQPGRDYQEAVNILGRPDYISWSNVISGQELFYISYELTEDRRVQLKMEKGGPSGYQIKEIQGLDRPDPAASSAPS